MTLKYWRSLCGMKYNPWIFSVSSFLCPTCPLWISEAFSPPFVSAERFESYIISNLLEKRIVHFSSLILSTGKLNNTHRSWILCFSPVCQKGIDERLKRFTDVIELIYSVYICDGLAYWFIKEDTVCVRKSSILKTSPTEVSLVISNYFLSMTQTAGGCVVLYLV